MRRWYRLAAGMLLPQALLIAGCLAPQISSSKEPIKLVMEVEAKPTVNPDEQGRAAPVLVRVYELKTEPTFQGADYFSLDKNDKAVLTQDMLARDEFILRPGESVSIERKLSPETTALGILVGYRELGKATWRNVYRLPSAPESAWYRSMMPSRKVKLGIVLDQQSITVTKSE